MSQEQNLGGDKVAGVKATPPWRGDGAMYRDGACENCGRETKLVYVILSSIRDAGWSCAKGGCNDWPNRDES